VIAPRISCTNLTALFALFVFLLCRRRVMCSQSTLQRQRIIYGTLDIHIFIKELLQILMYLVTKLSETSCSLTTEEVKLN
jgi:hypothetical protein